MQRMVLEEGWWLCQCWLLVSPKVCIINWLGIWFHVSVRLDSKLQYHFPTLLEHEKWFIRNTDSFVILHRINTYPMYSALWPIRRGLFYDTVKSGICHIVRHAWRQWHITEHIHLLLEYICHTTVQNVATMIWSKKYDNVQECPLSTVTCAPLMNGWLSLHSTSTMTCCYDGHWHDMSSPFWTWQMLTCLKA